MSLTSLQTAASQELASLQPEFNKIMASETYFKIGGPAEIFFTIKDNQALKQVLAFCRKHQANKTMIGGASNVIVSDEGISGVVLHLQNETIETRKMGAITLLTAGAGTKMALLVKASLDAKLEGLEYFLGVPGTLGGSIYNNAHYLSHLIGDYVNRVRVIDQDGNDTWLTQAECDFGYDHSRFQKSHEIIFEVTFSLTDGDEVTSQAKVAEATRYRAQTQPLGEASSGCIFQNTPNTPALTKLFPQFADASHIPGGFLIDQAGLKGATEGPIQVSHKHAAFFVNTGGGTAAQVLSLIGRVKQTVKEKFGVLLQEEVFFLR